jgi:hypothetical protein
MGQYFEIFSEKQDCQNFLHKFQSLCGNIKFLAAVLKNSPMHERLEGKGGQICRAAFGGGGGMQVPGH